LVGNFFEGAEAVRGNPGSFLVQCSAHPDVHTITEHYRHEIYVIDSFLFPAKEMALLARAEVEDPKTLGIVPAARGYVDLSRFDSVTEETANPYVADGLLDGRYDAGVTLHEFVDVYPGAFRVLERFGEVDTSWVVYGGRRRGDGKVHGQRIRSFLLGDDGAEDLCPGVEVGDGYAVGHLDDIGSGYGFRKVRRALGVTAFGVNALVRPPGYVASCHRHESQEELYFVHRGEIEIEFDDGTVHHLTAGGFARVDAKTVRRLRTVGDEEVVYVVAGGEGGYVGRDGQPAAFGAPVEG
jgi:mannose-6-phosphate isomerase-like protein (cupin superfamily)